MEDLFEHEQAVLDEAKRFLQSVMSNVWHTQAEPNMPTSQYSVLADRYAVLVKEYGRILKLVRRVTRVTDQTATELNADNKKLLDEVRYDGLTGIFNRRYFEEESEQVLRECAERRVPLGVLMLDVDFFKRYNDTYGHGMGDECLRKIAGALDQCVEHRPGFAARYGGEEFAILLPGADEAEVSAAGEEILCAVRELDIPHSKNDDRGHVTISIGGTSATVVEEARKTDYLRRADEALYQSKQTGRDCLTLLPFTE